VLFTNQVKPLHFSYQRFLENRLRAAFDFIGTPIRFTQRLKKREPRRDEHIAARGTHEAEPRKFEPRSRPKSRPKPKTKGRRRR
jgi:hypothetical protein